MAIQFPGNRKEVETRAKADVQASLPTSNPFMKNSFLGALITGYAGRVYEFYLQLRNALLQMFPDTATGDYLERWGSYVAINRNPSTPAQGFVVFRGTAGTVVPAGTTVSSDEGQQYTTDGDSTVELRVIGILSLNRTGSTVTAVSAASHRLATGQKVSMGNAVEPEYNGAYDITVVDEVTFTYTITGTPTTPATAGVGGIVAQSVTAYTSVTSVGYGSEQNQASGTQLTLSTPVAGLLSTVYVAYDEIAGGTDLEVDNDYRSRVLFRYQNPIALFNANAIKIEATKVPGVTRVWVFDAGTVGTPVSVTSLTRSSTLATVTTAVPHNLVDGQAVTISGASLLTAGYNGRYKVIVTSSTTFVIPVDSTIPTPATGAITASPAIPNGMVKIYFTRDNDLDPIPSGSEIADVKEQILTIKPAHVYDEDIAVLAPTAVPVNFVFSTLTPNTNAMREAIRATLRALFEDGTNVGESVPAAAYISAIWQTVDAGGNVVEEFTLSSPTGAISVGEGGLATLGTIGFPS